MLESEAYTTEINANESFFCRYLGVGCNYHKSAKLPEEHKLDAADYKLNIINLRDRYNQDTIHDHDERIDFLILYNSLFTSVEDIINTLKQDGLSAHYIVDKDAEIYQLVDDQKRTHLAGISSWGDKCNLDDTSINIEIINISDQFSQEKQIMAISELSKNLIKEYKIKPHNIIAHSDIAPESNFTAGADLINWEKFYQNIGAFDGLYDTKLTQDQQHKILLDNKLKASEEEIFKLQKNLGKYGYKIETTGNYDKQTMKVVRAFNSHFAPEIFKKEIDLNGIVVENPENQKWYGISQERLKFLLSTL